MTSLADAIAMVCTHTHVPMVQGVFGTAGVDAVFQIMQVVRELYMHVEPERVTGTIVIYRVVGTQDNAAPSLPGRGLISPCWPIAPLRTWFWKLRTALRTYGKPKPVLLRTWRNPQLCTAIQAVGRSFSQER